MSNAICNTNKDIPSDMLLGNLLFMNIRDMKIPENDLVSMFNSAGISTSFIRRISPADAYRRATSSIKGGKNSIVLNGNQGTINVDEVSCDENEVVRVISVHGIDEQNQDVEFAKILKFRFDRYSEQLDTDYIGQWTIGSNPELDNLVKTVNDRFDEWKIYHNKDTVRNLINRVVQSMHPISLMPTGICKFIPESKSDVVYSLKELMGLMSSYCVNNNEENIAEIIPVIDTVEQRGLVERNYTVEVVDEMNDLAVALNKAIAKGTLSSRQASSYIDRFTELKKKAEEYDNMLGIYSTNIRDQLRASLELVNDNTDEDE